MRTGQTTGLLVVTAVLLVVGLGTSDGRLLALTIPFLAYLAIGSLLPGVTPRIEVTRRVEKETAYAGERLQVSVTVRNLGPSLEFLELRDQVPGELEVVEGSNYLVLPLRQGETKELRYTVALRAKGKYNIGPMFLRSRDLLGLYFTEHRYEDDVGLNVSPRGEDVGRVAIHPKAVRPWLGQIPSRAAGPGTDYWAIRDYVSGDELRRINWKATGRLDTLLTNEYEGEKTADFVIILDAREEAAYGPIYDNAVEMGVRATISLARKLLEERNRVGLIVMRKVLDWVYPAFGKRQLHKLLEALLTVRPGGVWTLGHLTWVLSRFFPPQSQLIVITPQVGRATREAVAELKVRGFESIVVSPSTLAIEAELRDDNVRLRLAHAILRLERERNLFRLRRYAPVADWIPGQPLALALKEVETRRRVLAR